MKNSMLGTYYKVWSPSQSHYSRSSLLAKSLQHFVNNIKQTVTLDVVIIHQVDQTIAGGYLLNQIPGGGVRWVDITPMGVPQSKCLILYSTQKKNMINTENNKLWWFSAQ